MELQGHWEPGVMQGLTDDGQGLGDKTGWFPFPAIEDGDGDPTAQLGGGDAWAVADTAPDVSVDFVKYLLSDEVQQGFAENDMGLPTNPSASGSVSDPALAGLLEVRDQAPFVQLYFDTAFGESIGGAMNDEIALLFAGQASPEDVVSATQQAADERSQLDVTHQEAATTAEPTPQEPVARRVKTRRATGSRAAHAVAGAAGDPAVRHAGARPSWRCSWRGRSSRTPAARMSFYRWRGFGPMDDFVGLRNFTTVLTDEVFIGAVRHNLTIVVLSILVQLPLGLGIALLLNRRSGAAGCCARSSSSRTSWPR